MTVTLLLVSAHLVFILTELINESHIIHVSSIIAATVSSLFLGNYSRNTLSPKVDHYLDKVIEHIAFVANSLVFLMAGLLFASSGVDFMELWLPILATVFHCCLCACLCHLRGYDTAGLGQTRGTFTTRMEKINGMGQPPWCLIHYYRVAYP